MVLYLNSAIFSIKRAAHPNECFTLSASGLGSSTVDQVLKYTKYPKYIPSTSTGQVLFFF